MRCSLVFIARHYAIAKDFGYYVRVNTCWYQSHGSELHVRKYNLSKHKDNPGARAA